MFKIRRIKALEDNTPSRNLANEFINEQGSCATLILVNCMTIAVNLDCDVLQEIELNKFYELRTKIKFQTSIEKSNNYCFALCLAKTIFIRTSECDYFSCLTQQFGHYLDMLKNREMKILLNCCHLFQTYQQTFHSVQMLVFYYYLNHRP